VENEETDVSDNNDIVFCTNCSTEIRQFNCREDSCICRSLKRLYCARCTVEDGGKPESPKSIESTSEKPTKLVEQDDKISLIDALNMSRHSAESIFQLISRRQKSMLWIDQADFGECPEKQDVRQLADEQPKNCRRFPTKSFQEALDTFRANIYQHDLNFVESILSIGAKLDDQDTGRKLQDFDEGVREILKATSADSLIVVMLRLKHRAICCVKIRMNGNV